MDPGWVVAFASLATAVLTITVWFARISWRFTSRIMRFMDDYFGEPSAPGRPERPGVMVRLERLEAMSNDISHQVHLNSGATMRDTVQRTEAGVKRLETEFAQLNAKIAGGGSATP